MCKKCVSERIENRRKKSKEKIEMEKQYNEDVIKPMGTLICPRCGQIQVGKLDLKCDKCGLPNWDIEELKKGVLSLEMENWKRFI